MSPKQFTTLESCGLAIASAESTVKTTLNWGQCDKDALTEKKEDSLEDYDSVINHLFFNLLFYFQE